MQVNLFQSSSNQFFLGLTVYILFMDEMWLPGAWLEWRNECPHTLKSQWGSYCVYMQLFSTTSAPPLALTDLAQWTVKTHWCVWTCSQWDKLVQMSMQRPSKGGFNPFFTLQTKSSRLSLNQGWLKIWFWLAVWKRPQKCLCQQLQQFGRIFAEYCLNGLTY